MTTDKDLPPLPLPLPRRHCFSEDGEECCTFDQAQAYARQAVAEALAGREGAVPVALLEAFRTTQVIGGERPSYWMTFHFPTLAAMHAADDEWRAYAQQVRPEMAAVCGSQPVEVSSGGNCPDLRDGVLADPVAAQPAPAEVPADRAELAAECHKLANELAEWADHVHSRVAGATADLHAAIDRLASTPRPSDDELWDQTLKERDYYHGWADNLAYSIALHLGVDIGEHSSANNPWAAAFDAITEARPAPAQGEQTRSQKLASAGFTPRDTRIECDDCGAKCTPQMLPVHECQPANEEWGVPVDVLDEMEAFEAWYASATFEDMIDSEWSAWKARAALAAQPAAQIDAWRSAVDEALNEHNIDISGPEEAPAQAVKRLVDWVSQIAARPAAPSSTSARTLFDQKLDELKWDSDYGGHAETQKVYQAFEYAMQAARPAAAPGDAMCSVKPGWLDVRQQLRAAAAAPEPVAIRCKARLDNGGVCPHHNLQCGWPACNNGSAS